MDEGGEVTGDGDAGRPGQGPEAPGPRPRRPTDPPMSLLIVDDHDRFRAFARALLETDGFVVVGEAPDGASAVAAARRLDPDVVLLDVALPDLDGFAVCELITTPGGARPAVVLTSSRDASTFRQRLAQSRARGFVAKDDLTGPALSELTG